MSNGFNKEVKSAVKKMFWYDWALVKIACFLFGIMLVVIYPQMITWMPWYVWILLAIVFVIPLYYKQFMSSNKPKCKPGDLECRTKWAKNELQFWDWGLIKWASVVLGIAIAVVYTPIVTWMAWYYWAIIFAILIALPLYNQLSIAPAPIKIEVRSYKPKPKAKIRRR